MIFVSLKTEVDPDFPIYKKSLAKQSSPGFLQTRIEKKSTQFTYGLSLIVPLYLRDIHIMNILAQLIKSHLICLIRILSFGG